MNYPRLKEGEFCWKKVKVQKKLGKVSRLKSLRE